jgi:hypothetical protein
MPSRPIIKVMLPKRFAITGNRDPFQDMTSKEQSSDLHDRQLTPEAQRALEEAAARRAAREKNPAAPQEVGGREGPEPTRFGDWEKGGLASDF